MNGCPGSTTTDCWSGAESRASSFGGDHIYQDPYVDNSRFKLHCGDLSDGSNLTRLQPDDVYNLNAKGHMAVSFESPGCKADVDGMGTLCLLEAIRILGLGQKTPFYPRSPYAVTELDVSVSR